MRCLLCTSENVGKVSELSTAHIIELWNTNLSIDVASEFEGIKIISHYRCHECGLEFFSPQVAGSAALYEKLQEKEWYYRDDKWEHQIALSDVTTADRVLEVGCGNGDFVKRLQQRGIDAMGIELNPMAVDYARKQGRPVYHRRLEDLQTDGEHLYDVVCHFQVLEHVSCPKEFLLECLRVLKPGGRLLIGVPNSSGFVGADPLPLMNQPPHHITRWSPDVFAHIPKLYPLRVERVVKEPLAEYHLNWYFDILFSRFPHIKFVSGLLYRVTNRVAVPVVRKIGIYSLLSGHSVYACFSKR